MAKVAVKQVAKQGIRQVVKRGAVRVVQEVAKQGAKVVAIKAVQSTVTAAKTVAAKVVEAVPKVTVTRLAGPVGPGGLPVTISFSKRVGTKLEGSSSKVLKSAKEKTIKELSDHWGKQATSFWNKIAKGKGRCFGHLCSNKSVNAALKLRTILCFQEAGILNKARKLTKYAIEESKIAGLADKVIKNPKVVRE